VATAHEGRVYMGADSAGVGGLDMRVRRDAKVFVREGYLIGCTTSFRMLQLLRFSLAVPKRHPSVDLYEFMCTTFIDAVRNTLKAGGFATREKEAEQGGTFLVGIDGRVFSVYCDYQVAENDDGYAACGCGESYALGVLHATASGGMRPEPRLRMALEAAEHFSAGVRAPFLFKSEAAEA
jgi:hypothetical protein